MSSVAANLGLRQITKPWRQQGRRHRSGPTAAASLSKKNIRVNVVAPGLTHTQLAEKALGQAGIQASIAWHPLGRVGQLKDVALAVGQRSTPNKLGSQAQ